MGIVSKTNKQIEKLEINIAQTKKLIDESSEEYEINVAIREKYSLSQELSLLRKKLLGVVDPNKWQEYNDYVIECIDKVTNKDVNL